jgi:hypothetical protein
MKKFKIPCLFNGQKVPFDLYIGEPSDDLHPLHFQQLWLSSERGGSIPKEVMDSFQKLHNIAKENNVSFEELCMYALGQAAEEKKEQSDQTEKKIEGEA